MQVDLPLEVWGVLHSLAVERPVPRYVAMPAIQQFEAALQAAQQPPVETETPE